MDARIVGWGRGAFGAGQEAGRAPADVDAAVTGVANDGPAPEAAA